MQTEIQKLKDQVQEIHRDLTKHHSLIKTDTMSEILDRSLEMDGEISSEYASVELMRAMFEEVIFIKCLAYLFLRWISFNLNNEN